MNLINNHNALIRIFSIQKLIGLRWIHPIDNKLSEYQNMEQRKHKLHYLKSCATSSLMLLNIKFNFKLIRFPRSRKRQRHLFRQLDRKMI